MVSFNVNSRDIRLRDFTSVQPDFNITNTAMIN